MRLQYITRYDKRCGKQKLPKLWRVRGRQERVRIILLWIFSAVITCPTAAQDRLTAKNATYMTGGYRSGMGFDVVSSRVIWKGSCRRGISFGGQWKGVVDWLSHNNRPYIICINNHKSSFRGSVARLHPQPSGLIIVMTTSKSIYTRYLLHAQHLKPRPEYSIQHKIGLDLYEDYLCVCTPVVEGLSTIGCQSRSWLVVRW